MGGPTKRKDDTEQSLPQAHTGERTEIHDAHGVHSGGQNGNSPFAFPFPPTPLSTGQGHEQPAGPEAGGLLGKSANTSLVPQSHSRRSQTAAVSPQTSTIPVRHHRPTVGGYIRNRHSSDCPATSRWPRRLEQSVSC